MSLDLCPNSAAAAKPPPSTTSRGRPVSCAAVDQHRRREKGEEGGILRENPTTVVTPIRSAPRDLEQPKSRSFSDPIGTRPRICVL
jgi:hypothetical protein